VLPVVWWKWDLAVQIAQVLQENHLHCWSSDTPTGEFSIFQGERALYSSPEILKHCKWAMSHRPSTSNTAPARVSSFPILYYATGFHSIFLGLWRLDRILTLLSLVGVRSWVVLNPSHDCLSWNTLGVFGEWNTALGNLAAEIEKLKPSLQEGEILTDSVPQERCSFGLET